jgi:hypothetical protein
MSTGAPGAMLQAVRAPLAELGFTERTGRIFTVVLRDDVLGWLGLNTASEHHRDAVGVNPVVGVKHLVVERFLEELRDGGPWTATVSIPLGYVMQPPKYREWAFELPDMTRTATEMVGAVNEFGLPYMRNSSSLDQIRARIAEGHGQHLEYVLPVVLELLGKPDAAEAALESTERESESRTDLAAESFREFAAALRCSRPLQG